MAIRFSSKAETIVGAPSPKSSVMSSFLCETSVSSDLLGNNYKKTTTEASMKQTSGIFEGVFPFQEFLITLQ